MKTLQIIQELEANPSLITQKLAEIKQRREELLTLDNVYKGRKTKIMTVMNLLDLPANKLVKIAVLLKKVMKEAFVIQGELRAIEYFENGSDSSRIKNSLETTVARWKVQAQENYDSLFN